jgi:ferric enterobactin receptor
VGKGIVLLLFLVINFNLQAQRKQESNLHAGITGKVIDSVSGEPLNYATITLFLAGNKKPVNGSTTNAKGMFSVNDVADGNYKVVVEYIGYRPFAFDSIRVNQQNLPVDLKTISLMKKAAVLQTK